MENVKVVLWGYGAMGKGIAEMLLNKKGVEITGVCDTHPNLVGKGFIDLLNVSSDHDNIVIVDNIDSLLDSSKADIAILATDSFTAQAYPKIEKVVTKGIHVISTAEEMAYPMANEPELAKQMNELAKKHNVTILGTGINPGFVLDLLVITLTGAMSEVKHIEAKRVNSLSPFGPAVMEEQGVGISIDEYNTRIHSNELAGHVGFKESVFMIADAIGVKLSDFKQQMAPIVSNVYRKSKYGQVEPNHLAGIDMTAQGYLNQKVFIDMKHPQQIEPELEGTHTGDYINIQGVPNISLSVQPEIDGGIGTIAMCVNMIPHVINASSGLKTMIDLPIPRAILGDMRELINR